MTTDPAETATAVVDAINSRDPQRLRELVGPDSAVVTGRTTHTGEDAILRWAAKEYDHLVRRYAIDEYRERDGSVLALGSVQYVWNEGGEVADSTPIAIAIEVGGERLQTLQLHDDTAAALAAFEG